MIIFSILKLFYCNIIIKVFIKEKTLDIEKEYNIKLTEKTYEYINNILNHKYYTDEEKKKLIMSYFNKLEKNQ